LAHQGLPATLSNLPSANGKTLRHVVTDGVFQVCDGTLAGNAAVQRIRNMPKAEDWFAPTARQDNATQDRRSLMPDVSQVAPSA